MRQDENVMHIAGGLQHLLDRMRIKVPRALCGVRLDGHDDPAPGAPFCPACESIAGPQLGSPVKPHRVLFR